MVRKVLLLILALVAPAALAEKTQVSLTSGNVVLTVDDGTYLTLSPGTDLSVQDGVDGVPQVALEDGEIHVSTVFSTSGGLVIRSGGTELRVGRATVLLTRRGGVTGVTLLHGDGVLLSGGGQRLVQPGMRVTLGPDGPSVDRPDAAEMDRMLRGVGIPTGLAAGGQGRPPMPGAGGPPRPTSQGRGRVVQLDQAQGLVATGQVLAPSPSDGYGGYKPRRPVPPRPGRPMGPRQPGPPPGPPPWRPMQGPPHPPRGL